MKNKKNSENEVDQILIAEDSPTQAEQLKYLLEKHNYKVMVAKDGKEALSLVGKHAPTLVISDIVMPEMNGYELCIEIKSNESTMDIPVILLTALTRSEDVLEGISCGADNFITKPYREDYLISHIEQILANRRIQKNERVRVGVEIIFGGKRRFITASQQQMLTLLISTYEAAVQRNDELVQTQEELKTLNEHLEEIVIERTAELSAEIVIRKSTEERVYKLNRVYAVLSNINQAIVRIHDINQVFKDACTIAVDEGKFQSAWIGIVNNETKKIETSATAGLTNDLTEVSPDQNPVTEVIRSGNHFISNNITDHNSLPEIWKQNSLSFGFRSFAVFPLIVFGKAIGAFCIYSNEVAFFDELEINLLDEIANDISFGLEYIQKESERRLAEEKLIQSEERYKRITEGLTDYLYTVIVKDGKAVETINSETCFAITGYTKKEFSEDPYLWINMVVPEEREFVAKRASKILGGKEQPPIEHRIRCKDGQIRWIMDTIIPNYDADGRLISYDGVIQDITGRKQSELLLREKNKEIEVQNEKLNQANTELIIAKEKAEESDRLKSAFLANMSHEIRTPMNGILGFAELLKGPDLTGENQQSYISIIEKSGTRMLNIINDIISISKIESGQMGVSTSETNINEQIEYIFTFFKPEVEQKGLQISCQNALPAKEAIIKTDREKIYAILTNLVRNAIKFTKTGSIKFGCEKKGNHLQFFVTDTGIGIRTEQLKFIFERFRQGSESLTRNYEGAGLGLSISKAYVEMLGGKIWTESEEGKGSTFYFTIPYDTQTEDKIVSKNVVSADVEKDQMKKLKILIAENDEISEVLIALSVKMFGKEVLIVRTGIEAVETCRINPDIDLILMDIKMPGMDGYEATRQIRQFNTGVVIIAQTAYALEGDKKKAIEAGCTDYISKPIRKNELMVLIQKYFKK